MLFYKGCTLKRILERILFFGHPLLIGSFQGVFVPAVEKTVLYDVADERGQF